MSASGAESGHLANRSTARTGLLRRLIRRLAHSPRRRQNQRVLFEMQRDLDAAARCANPYAAEMLAHKAFTPRTVERLRNNIEAITEDLLDAVQDTRKMDLKDCDLASPLPVTVIAELIGIPEADRSMFQHWSHALAFTLELTDDPQVFMTQGRRRRLNFQPICVS